MKNNVKNLIYAALFSALIAILAQLKIDLPSLVPITLQTLGVYLVSLLLRPRYAVLSCIVYILMGLVLPVFSGFQSFSAIFGPAGGFILSFPIMALIISFTKNETENNLAIISSLLLATIVCYIMGVSWFCLNTNSSLVPAISMVVLPYIPGDIIKMVVAFLISKRIQLNH